jgi:hypothetical protein
MAPAELQHLLSERYDMQATAGMLLRVAYHVLQHYERRLGAGHFYKRGPLLTDVNIARVHTFAQLAGQRPEEIRSARCVREIEAAFDPVPEAS